MLSRAERIKRKRKKDRSAPGGTTYESLYTGSMVRALHQIGLGVCLIGAGLSTTCSTAQSTEVQQAFQRAAAAMRAGQSAEAEREFRNVIQLDPRFPDAYLDLGLVLGREGKTPEAIETIQQSLTLKPDLQAANMFLGIFQYQAGQNDSAIQSLNKELALNPRSAETLTWLGIVQLAAGHPELAVGPLDKAVELSPRDLSLLEYRGRAHSQVAQATYARMAQIDPDAWQVHKVRAELFAADNKDREAIVEYQQALTRETRNPDLYEGLGDAYRHLNEFEQARQAYRHELELSPQNPLAMYNLGSTEVDLGDFTAGVPLLKAMLKNYRSSPNAEFYLARGLAGLGQDAEAAELFEKTAREDPDGEVGKRSYLELARIYHRMHRPEDAQRALASYNHLRDRDGKKATGADSVVQK